MSTDTPRPGDPRRAAAQPSAADPGLYKAREKIHPREIKGRFQSLRKLAVLTLLGLFYLAPWLRWDDRQAVLFDLPGRQFHVLGLTFWPQDFFFLALFLIVCALMLFFFTALAGRLWCGYACPQTVWTEVFIWIEQWCEGDRNKRIKLDKAPWSREKLIRRSSKHVLWVLFAAWTGFTFVGFFTPVTELTARLAAFQLGPWESFWMAFYGFATWGNAGFMREQVCLYMCPYARFQSAMFDPNTLTISYDERRGEPRGPRRREADHQALGLGDCIDCYLCVQVCPTGIDIRDGLQYECIACAACIDACDSVMDKVGYPRGLIRYTTENALAGKRSRILRPRILIYGLLLALITGGAVAALAMRSPLDMDVLPDRNALYREAAGGVIENVYTLHTMNKSGEDARFRLEVAGAPGLSIITTPETFTVASGASRRVAARVSAEPGAFARGGGHNIQLILVTIGKPEQRYSVETRFHTPVR
ncbi:cytochrome c oxidase accessory protein CcoG [Alkalilimnicola sp. S0819]|uniref:cytochrome c oxidase accessory protein CcoG n=1 Tax=Alkalilimnicola sp. S0819 TaxID=2613922 RepID=UPI0012628775|nr:cytochrome c oxidase accessory protein CcoG [Alkalilimnicola sp. S0819]KAB7628198.1 cytochrome c oxidase accessory protein CcoG [Alkalilimnicola sp. S0819]MPQ15087.1 cytochrome c oxidase accessory protein CcoG [Alkalilimnicola sp. S0819]